ncbi:MAG TPA: polyribonucleotide nucleotidyltransferase [Verrucomicrobiae bacterium]|nr:polyribonucleotide nucleotidyltransferase [Verrucomicrobiae bacterium]
MDNTGIRRAEKEIGGRKLVIETGRVAKQADGAVTVQFGDTMVFASAVASKEAVEGQDFFPLTVDYREKAYAAGKIPGGYFKREGRPSEKEILTARLIDRPLRPLFPEGYFNEVQIMVMALSYDQENDPDVLGIIAASSALMLSSIPFNTPIAGVRVGRVEGQLIAFPTAEQLETSDVNIVLAGTKDSIVMVEGGSREISEADMIAALDFGHQQLRILVGMIEDLTRQAGKPKSAVTPPEMDPNLVKRVKELAAGRINAANKIHDKAGREAEIGKITEEVLAALAEEFPEQEGKISKVLEELEQADLRRAVVEEKRRADGRGPADIRPVSCQIGFLPRTHGSALFTRGQTQSLAAVTLGTKMDEQKIDALEGESYKSYMLHYNFPPFSVGEVRPLRGPGRREIGHGALAERAIEPVIPAEGSFPYTIRIVSDILESNGSSSMATVCSGSLSLMDAGVPIKAPVAGIAMGLIKEGDKVVILSDILGVEDHLGDMDFKVTGTRQGITAFQMDLKTAGITLDIMGKALEQAKAGRLHILEIMEKTISKPKPELSPYAPRIITIKIKPDRIGEVIGPGGKNIRAIVEQTGAKIDIEDDGTVLIASVDGAAGEAAKNMILGMVEEPEIGRVYEGKVRRIAAFGAFVEILPGTDGLIHISELDTKRVARVEDVLKLGDMVTVKVIGIDPEGKVRLSRKAVLENAPKFSEARK